MSHKKKTRRELKLTIQNLRLDAKQLVNLEDILEITRQEASGWHLKCIEAEHLAGLYQEEITRLVDDRLNVDREALEAAQRDELVQTAENVARIAGNRMDALERFYNDLLAGKYNELGVFPAPSPSEEPLAPWEKELLKADRFIG